MSNAFKYAGLALLVLLLMLSGAFLLGRATAPCIEVHGEDRAMDSLRDVVVARFREAEVMARDIDSLRKELERRDKATPTIQDMFNEKYKHLDRVPVDSLAGILLAPVSPGY